MIGVAHDVETCVVANHLIVVTTGVGAVGVDTNFSGVACGIATAAMIIVAQEIGAPSVTTRQITAVDFATSVFADFASVALNPATAAVVHIIDDVFTYAVADGFADVASSRRGERASAIDADFPFATGMVASAAVLTVCRRIAADIVATRRVTVFAVTLCDDFFDIEIFGADFFLRRVRFFLTRNHHGRGAQRRKKHDFFHEISP